MDRPRAKFVGLLNAEESHRSNPASFAIPRSELRRSLVPGALVKLLFGFGDPPPNAERMWVEVVEVVGDGYVGRLDNDPSAISDLALNDVIRFGPEHVSVIWRGEPAPLAPQPGQFAVVSSRIWQGGAWPQRLVRTPPPSAEFSGWFLFAADDPPMPPNDLAGFEPVSHSSLSQRLRSFDSVEDEPPGTEWNWVPEAFEWQRAR